jgi:hypothetical protein
MYMPVAAQAAGGKPRPMMIGFQTTPPPNPTDEANPPPTAASDNNQSDLPWYEMSDLHVPVLVIYLSCYSNWQRLVCMKATRKQVNKNDIKIPTSAELHFCMFTIEGFLLDPRKRLTTKARETSAAQSKCTRH